jgi:hypothetical protein
MEGRVYLREVGHDGVADRVRDWTEAQATHLSITFTGAGLTTPDDQITALADIADAIGLKRRG